jgi:hypothetical protein
MSELITNPQGPKRISELKLMSANPRPETLDSSRKMDEFEKRRREFFGLGLRAEQAS